MLPSMLLVTLILCACGPERASFRPAEHATASGHGGQPAASYEVRAAPNEDPTILVNVWSQGARSEEGRTHVHLTLEVRNTGRAPVTVDPQQLRLEAYANDGRPLPEGHLVRIAASEAAVLPGQASTMQLHFALAPQIEPAAIGALRLRWALVHDDGRQYVQFTGFQRVPEAGVGLYDPVYGFYDPFFYGPPHGFHAHYYVPVRRVIVRRDRDRDRPRDERRTRQSAR